VTRPACLVLLLAALAAAAPDIAVTKYVKGNLRVSAETETGAAAEERDLGPSELLKSGTRIVAGQDGKAVIRLLPDNAFLEVRPKTVFKLRRTKKDGKRLRRIRMEAGEVVFGLRKKSDPVQCENANSQATSATARFSCKVDEKAAAVFIVQDGELSVFNQPKGLTALVRAGQKAVSDLEGIRITDATDEELDQVGFRQNTLEVDFLNPQSDEFNTLEIEYETSF
jgi:hypothetical protein